MKEKFGFSYYENSSISKIIFFGPNCILVLRAIVGRMFRKVYSDMPIFMFNEMKNLKLKNSVLCSERNIYLRNRYCIVKPFLPTSTCRWIYPRFNSFTQLFPIVWPPWVQITQNFLFASQIARRLHRTSFKIVSAQKERIEIHKNTDVYGTHL